MFNIFKKRVKTQEFTNYLLLHEAIEKKMSEMVACDAMRTLKVRSLKDITNGNVRYSSLSDEQLANITRQMQKADLIMIKATAEMARKHNDENTVVFEDNTIYTVIQKAQEWVRPKELDAFETREDMIKYINEKAEFVLSMERNMSLFLVEYAKKNNQAVVVHV